MFTVIQLHCGARSAAVRAGPLASGTAESTAALPPLAIQFGGGGGAPKGLSVFVYKMVWEGSVELRVSLISEPCTEPAPGTHPGTWEALPALRLTFPADFTRCPSWLSVLPSRTRSFIRGFQNVLPMASSVVARENSCDTSTNVSVPSSTFPHKCSTFPWLSPRLLAYKAASMWQ